MARIAIRNRLESTVPVIVHANGVADSAIWRIVKERFFATAKFEPVADHGMDRSWASALTVLTWNTTGKESVFERSCKVLGVNIQAIKMDIENVHREQGVMCSAENQRVTYPIKILGTVQALDSVTTEYVMMVDAFDAILLDSPGRALGVFRKHVIKDGEGDGDTVLFGAERGHFPGQLDTYDVERQKILGAEHKLAKGLDRPFLNAGCVIGKTKAVHDLYRKAEEVGRTWDRECLLTDQATLKVLYAGGENIILDHHCRICQNLFGVVAGELDLLRVDFGLRLEAV